MNQDMKEVQKLAEEKGYELVRYDEHNIKKDEEIKDRFLFIFEKK